MRIVHYSTRLGRSGGGLHHSVSGLARAMAGLGAEVMVAGGVENRFEEERHVWGKVPLLTHAAGPLRYGFSPAMLRRIERLKPDILHVHGLWSASAIYGRFAPRGTRIVVSPRGMLDPWILARRPLIKAIHARLFERPVLARAHLHALSEHEAQAVRDFLPATAPRIFTLPNGISPPTSRTGGPRKGALYLGRLHEKKQVLPLIEAWERYAKSMSLTVAGWGAPAYEAQIARRCAGCKRVRFAGALHGAEKVAAYENAEFFLLPSVSEGLPMAALEALSHGAIPILTDSCHLPNLFSADVALRLDESLADFARVLSRIEAMSEAEKLERSSRARLAARQYLWPDIARSMLDHYARIIEEARP